MRVFFCDICQKKVTVVSTSRLPNIELLHDEHCIPAEDKLLNEQDARSRYDLDLFDGERLTREFNDDPNAR